MGNRYIAEYLRISNDDEDLGEEKIESNSIENQGTEKLPFFQVEAFLFAILYCDLRIFSSSLQVFKNSATKT